MILVIFFVVLAVGGGGFFLIWLKTRPHRLSWIARCYQKGEGVREIKIDKEGQPIEQKFKLQDLKPYFTDILQRLDYKSGTIYRLAKLDMTTNAVVADMVDVWSPKEKYVDVLIDGDTATILKKGYDVKTGNLVFQPMPRERIELIKSEIVIKRSRMEKDQGILAKVIPWIVVGLSLFALMGVAYFMGDSFVKVAKIADESQKRAIAAEKETVQAIEDHMDNLGVQPAEPREPVKPPPIE